MAFFQKIRYCIVNNPPLLGDGICHNFGSYNSAAGCGFDGGDCNGFNTKYPNCEAEDLPAILNNSKCDGGVYNKAACDWDGGVCVNFNKKYPNCRVDKPFRCAVLVGNGKCDGDEYNTTQCGFDGGDCLDFWANFPNCTVEYPPWIGDDYCDGGDYNTADCNNDDGDCDVLLNRKHPNCKFSNPSLVDDGKCDEEGGYNTADLTEGIVCFPERFHQAPQPRFLHFNQPVSHPLSQQH